MFLLILKASVSLLIDRLGHSAGATISLSKAMTAIEAIGISGLASSIGLLHGLGLEDRRPSLAGLLSVLARFEN